MKILNETGHLTEHGKEFVSHFESDIDAIFLSHEFIMLGESEQKTLESVLKGIVAEKFSTNRTNLSKMEKK